MKHHTYTTALRYTAAALLLAAAASCSGDDTAAGPAPGDNTDNGGRPTVTVRFASADDGGGAADGGGQDGAPETRTALGDDGSTVLWQPKDEIAIFAVTSATGEAVSGAGNLPYNPVTAAASSAFAPADGGEEMVLPEGTYDFRSYYPYNKWFATAAKVTFTLGAMTQAGGSSGAHIGPMDFMWAPPVTGVNVSDGGGGSTVTFGYRHAFPMLVFTVTNDGGRTIELISVSTADGTGAVRGQVRVSLTDGTVKPSAGLSSSTTLTFTTPMGAGGTGRLLILPQEAGKELVIGARTTDGHIYEYRRTPANGLTGGKSYGFEFDLSDGEVDGRTVYTIPGTGAGNTRQIGTPGDLRGFAAAVNRYGLDAANAVLTAGIGLGDEAWEPIGSGDVPYRGTFDGDGHTVSGLSVNTTKDYAGLFGHLEDATVRDLGVRGTVKGAMYAGGIAGCSRAAITNCFFDGTVSGTESVGGIAGANDEGTITGCFTSGSVTATGKYAGGIAGYNESLSHGADQSCITACYSSAGVTANGYAGGIAGYSRYATACYATGNVSATSDAAGITGYNTGMLSGCIALGASVSRTSGTATTFGRVAGNTGVTIADCAAYGGMTVNGAAISGNDASATATGIHGAPLTAAECLLKATYTARGFTEGNDGWTFGTAAPWTNLPWRTELYDRFKDAVRIPVPAHLTAAPAAP